jgi:biotin synthase
MDKDCVGMLYKNRDLPDEDLKLLIETDAFDRKLFTLADSVRREYYGTEVYLRGLIEFTNICKNDCGYCGIRRSNDQVKRYRLTKDEILACCAEGYDLGFRTYVLQGGEDMFFSDDAICEIVSSIRSAYPDCAITLSIGEKSKESYQRYFNAGARRYLLRHETADEVHYARLHPATMRLANRKKCLFDLKDIGYQVGAGMMVGSPFQTTENLIADLRFLQELRPDMIGIGPFIPHAQTPFAAYPAGSLALTLRLLAILRLMFPSALIPATTALGTIAPNGRELGLKAGANVVMPNLSPVGVRKMYQLYDNKICTGDESAQCRACLERRINSCGFYSSASVGNRRAEKIAGDAQKRRI